MDAIRQRAHTSSTATAKRMVQKSNPNREASQYFVKDRVWLKPDVKRVARGGKPIHRPMADAATVIGTNWKLKKYKVEYIEFGSNRRVQKWVTVDRLASLTREEEHQRSTKTRKENNGLHPRLSSN